MADQLTIQDGVPYVWNSPSIIPSNDTMLPTTVPSNVLWPVDPVVTNEINVYVYVENTGSSDFGTCACPTGPWGAPFAFAGFSPNPVVGTTVVNVLINFSATAGGGKLTSGANNITFQFPGTELATAHAWGLNKDKTLFGYAATTTANPTTAGTVDWWVWITPVDAGTFGLNPLVNSIITDTVSGAFALALFGWGGPAVVVNGPNGGMNRKVTVIALPAAATAYPLAVTGGVSGWVCVVSPCGSAIALASQKAGGTAGPPDPDFILVLTATTAKGKFKQMGADVATGVGGLLQSDGMNPTFSTSAHNAMGIDVDLGDGGSPVKIDDPDCTFIGGGVKVIVTRVQSTSTPTSGMGVIAVGNGSLGTISHGAASWVKVPSPGSWTAAGTGHWCLLAEATTTDLTTIAPWDQVSDYRVDLYVNRAQRNIQIS